MTRYLSILALATLVACGGDKDGTDGDTGGGDTDDPACANSVQSQLPEANATDVYYKTDIRVTLAAEEPAAEIVVTDGGGAVVSGTSVVDGETVVWTADAALSPETEYTVTVNFGCDPVVYTLTTSDVGTPLGATNIIGNVYALDIATGDWIEPENVGAVLAGFLEGTEVFVAPTEIAGGKITMLGGIGSGGTQDLCSPTIPFPAADWTDPFFELAADTLTLEVADLQVNIDDLELSGAFAPDGSRIQGTSLRGVIDTRALVDLVEEGGADDAVCVLATTLGVSCVDCGDGSSPYCLSVWVDNIAAAQIAGGTLIERTDEQIATDPTCTPTP